MSKAKRKRALKFLTSNSLILENIRIALDISPDVSRKQMIEVVKTMMKDYCEYHPTDSFNLSINGPQYFTKERFEKKMRADSIYDEMTYGNKPEKRFVDEEENDEIDEYGGVTKEKLEKIFSNIK